MELHLKRVCQVHQLFTLTLPTQLLIKKKKKMMSDLDDRLPHLSQEQLKYKHRLHYHTIVQYKQWGSEAEEDKLIHHFRSCQTAVSMNAFLLPPVTTSIHHSLTTGNEWRHYIL